MSYYLKPYRARDATEGDLWPQDKMPTLPNVKTNNINKNIVNNRNKIIIQDASLKSSSNNPDSNSMDNNSWTTQANKRNLSSSSNPQSEPPSLNPNTNIIQKKMFATRNRFEILAQNDPFETTSTAENIPLNSHQITDEKI